MRRPGQTLGACLAIAAAITAAAVGWSARHAAAQADAPPAGQGTNAPGTSPAAVVDHVMGLLADGRVDDAVGSMDGLKAQPDLREDARAKLLRLRDGTQGTYRGYDLAATVRFSPRLQTADVLAYYDQQPALLRFLFYHPGADDAAAWVVLDFRVTADVAEATDVLRADNPALSAGRTGRGGR